MNKDISRDFSKETFNQKSLIYLSNLENVNLMKLPSKTTSLVVIMRKRVLPHPFLDLKPTRKLTVQTGMLHPAQGSTGVLTSRTPDAMRSCARPTARLRECCIL